MVDWPDELREALGGARLARARRPRVRRTADLAARSARSCGGSRRRSASAGSDRSPSRRCSRRSTRSSSRRRRSCWPPELPGVAVSLSHEIGRVGLLERENATIMNACLRSLAADIVAAFRSALAGFGIEAPVYLSQNDGTLMSVEHTERYPVATFASGPTNSMRGAAFLSGLDDCAVVDIGGTTADVGHAPARLPARGGGRRRHRRRAHELPDARRALAGHRRRQPRRARTPRRRSARRAWATS